VKKHGWSKHRTWRKIHLTINPANNDIEAVELTRNTIDDAVMVAPMLNQIEKEHYMKIPALHSQKHVADPIVYIKLNTLIGWFMDLICKGARTKWRRFFIF
jgi:hypothetical protein